MNLSLPTHPVARPLSVLAIRMIMGLPLVLLTMSLVGFWFGALVSFAFHIVLALFRFPSLESPPVSKPQELSAPFKDWADEIWLMWERWGNDHYKFRKMQNADPIHYATGSAGEKLMLRRAILTNSYNGDVISSGYDQDSCCPRCWFEQIQPEGMDSAKRELSLALKDHKMNVEYGFTSLMKSSGPRLEKAESRIASLEMEHQSKIEALGPCRCGFHDHLNMAIARWEAKGNANQLARQMGMIDNMRQRLAELESVDLEEA